MNPHEFSVLMQHKGQLRIILLQMGIKLPHVGKNVIKKDDDIQFSMKQSVHEVHEY
jgi:hypothetical protein